jgi:hypothetical protein
MVPDGALEFEASVDHDDGSRSDAVRISNAKGNRSRLISAVLAFRMVKPMLHWKAAALAVSSPECPPMLAAEG